MHTRRRENVLVGQLSFSSNIFLKRHQREPTKSGLSCEKCKRHKIEEKSLIRNFLEITKNKDWLKK